MHKELFEQLPDGEYGFSEENHQLYFSKANGRLLFRAVDGDVDGYKIYIVKDDWEEFYEFLNMKYRSPKELLMIRDVDKFWRFIALEYVIAGLPTKEDYYPLITMYNKAYWIQHAQDLGKLVNNWYNKD